MTQYRFLTADVFTDRIFGGNQLAVFPDARGLDTSRMQEVAREFNLSETVFVFSPDDPRHTRRLRIFTPARELPFAGHPTVGTGFVLAAIGDVPLAGAVTRIVFEEGVGAVPVSIRAEGGRPVFSQLSVARLPELGPEPPPREEIAAVLSLAPGEIGNGRLAPRGASCGVPFLFVPLPDRSVLARARLDLGLWERRFADTWAPALYPFTADPELPGSDLRARMFGPGLGMVEDPASGAAVAAFAGYLAAADPRRDGTLRWVVEQGFEMGRPSLLQVEADLSNGAVTAVRVGGASVLVGEGTMEIPA